MADRMVKCVKLSRELPGLDRPPFKKGAFQAKDGTDFGEKIFESVSKDAWRMWLEHSKMFVNEYRLDMTSPAHQATWFRECEKYFFGEGSALPAEYKPVEQGQPAGHDHAHHHDHDHAHDHAHDHDKK